MKKLIAPYILFILIITQIVLANSSITMETTINQNVHVTFKFVDIEPQLYSEIKNQGFNTSTIPNAIEGELKRQKLTDARVIYDLNQQIFKDDTHSIHLEFLLAGSDILSYTSDRTGMSRTFQVRTDWRKFQVNFAQNLSLNFEEHFRAPLTEWQQVDLGFEKSIESPFEMSFRFILPEEAFDIQAEDNTIIFKVPPVFEDTLLNSPFLILGVIIIANIIFMAYRKARK